MEHEPTMSPRPPGALRARLESGGFAVTAEIGPPRGADTGPIRRTAGALRGWVDAVNLTDNQGSHVRLASWAASVAALEAGAEPIMQLTCRDRNRIALQSDLLGAAAVGVPNVLLLTGDHPAAGDHADAKPVFDLDSVQLLNVARMMRDEGRLLSGRSLDPPPDLFLGAVEHPAGPAGPAAGPPGDGPPGAGVARLADKVAAGAQFVQTQPVFYTGGFAAWLARVRDLGLDERCHILAGVGLIRSLRALEYMRDGVPGVPIPAGIERRLRGVLAGRVAEEGRRIAAEIVQQVGGLPGAAGVHIIAFGDEGSVPEILERAGVGRRGAPGGAGPGGPGHSCPPVARRG
jgi:methylenetetrahydrofolate reductase (NADPH)